MKSRIPVMEKAGSGGFAQANRNAPRFIEADRRIVMNLVKKLPVNEGKSLDVVRMQVKWLENRLPAMAIGGTLRVRKADVRKKIQTVRNPLAKAIDALENLERICASEDANLEDRAAYLDARSTNGEDVLAILRRLHGSCIEAEEWWTEQATSRAKVRTQPMWLIAQTLGLDNPGIELGNDFLSIVEACYRAAGLCSNRGDTDLTRPFNKFMAERRRAIEQ